MKKVLFLVAVFALVAAPVGAYPWLGDIDVAGNYETGNRSYNYASNTEVDALVVGNVNTGVGVNNVTASSNTGANDVVGNSGDVRLVTGDAYTGVFAQNSVNTNTIAILDGCGCEEDGMDLAGNAYTGDNSTNYATNLDVDVTLVGNVNNGTGVNNVDASSNTGANDVYDNGGEYQLRTSKGTNSYTNANFYVFPHQYRVMGYGYYHHGESSYYNYEVSYPRGGDVVVYTGDADTRVTAVNLVNTNNTTVVRGYDLRQ